MKNLKKYVFVDYYNKIKVYLKETRKMQIGVVLISVVSTITLIGYNWTLKVIVDDALIKKDFKVLVNITLIYIFLVLISYISNLLKSYLFSKINQKVLVKARSDLFNHVIKQKYSFFLEHRTGDIMYRIMTDMNNTLNAFFSTLLELITNSITALLTIIWLLYINWKFTVLLICTIPLYLYFNKLISKNVYENSKKVNELSSNSISLLKDALDGIETIKVYNVGNLFGKKFKDLLEGLASKVVKLNLNLQISYQSMDILLKPMMALFYFIFGISYIKYGQPSLGSILAYANYFWVLFPAAVGIVSLYNKIISVGPSIERILEYYETEVELNGTEEIDFSQNISFENITFYYNENEIILNDLSLSIKKGETIAIVGRSGCGKSTLVKLLLRLYYPSEGRILIDEFNLTDYDVNSLRKHVGVVSQDVYLFNMSIKDNIKIASDSATDDEIIHAAELAEIHNFIVNLPQGYDTIVEEHGLNLSGGERQRISLARVFLKKPDIIIMDEPTSAIDITTETEIMNNINMNFKESTKIIITHRLSNLENADRIFRLEKGVDLREVKYSDLLKI